MKIGFVPSIGRTSGESSPANVASKNIYSFVRFANSGRTNYEATDLMMFLLAMDNAYMYAGYLIRIYGIIMKNDPSN